MGLRAFTSQLLCEQVVGRGLRCTSYEVDPETGLFEPEYVNIFRTVQRVLEAVRQEDAKRLEPVFDRDHPIRSTGDMRTWYTGKPCARTKKSHINFCVYDSSWEALCAFVLDNSKAVAA